MTTCSRRWRRGGRRCPWRCWRRNWAGMSASGWRTAFISTAGCWPRPTRNRWQGPRAGRGRRPQGRQPRRGAGDAGAEGGGACRLLMRRSGWPGGRHGAAGHGARGAVAGSGGYAPRRRGGTRCGLSGPAPCLSRAAGRGAAGTCGRGGAGLAGLFHHARRGRGLCVRPLGRSAVARGRGWGGGCWRLRRRWPMIAGRGGSSG